MNQKSITSGLPVSILIHLTTLAAIVLLSGCGGGGSKTSTALPTFKEVYTFSNPMHHSQLTALPDGTAYAIVDNPTGTSVSLAHFSDFGRGPAIVIGSPVATPDASYAVAVSPVNGNIYVDVPSAAFTDIIGVFNSSGQELFTFSNPAPLPSNSGSDRIVIDSKGFVYILGSQINASKSDYISFLYKCDPNGNLIKSIDVSKYTYGPYAPMVIDASDHIYFSYGIVSEITTDGALIKQFSPNLGETFDVGVDGNGNIYVTGIDFGGLYTGYRFSPDGTRTAQIANGILHFTVDTNGTVYTLQGVFQVTK